MLLIDLYENPNKIICAKQRNLFFRVVRLKNKCDIYIYIYITDILCGTF